MTRAMGAPPDPEVDAADAEAEEGARARIDQQTAWVDRQVRAAIARGDFDNLPGAGKPLKLPDTHDPDWWAKQLIEREKITGVAPPAIGLRAEDAALDGELDRMATEEQVREALADFNRRVVAARRQLQGGPPVITPTRDGRGRGERVAPAPRGASGRRARRRAPGEGSRAAAPLVATPAKH